MSFGALIERGVFARKQPGATPRERFGDLDTGSMIDTAFIVDTGIVISAANPAPS